MVTRSIRSRLVSTAIAVAVAGLLPAATASAAAVKGSFSTILMVHTTQSSYGDLPNVNPWNGVPKAGETFQYRSIPCTGPAPVNNISSDLPSYGGRVQGSRAPSSMRGQPFAFRLRKVHGRGKMIGRIHLTVCRLGGGPNPAPDPVPDASKPYIMVRFQARFRRMTDEVLTYSGRLRLDGGTGRYADITGKGSIAGYLFCFNPAGCASIGRGYLDNQMAMTGTYRDPTPQLGG